MVVHAITGIINFFLFSWHDPDWQEPGIPSRLPKKKEHDKFSWYVETITTNLIENANFFFFKQNQRCGLFLNPKSKDY